MQPTQLGFYSKNNIWNSVVIIDDSLYRERVECLIIKNNRVFLCFKSHSKYRIPGGSSEPKKTLEQQVIDECKEESRIIVDDLYFVETYDEVCPKNKYGVEYTGRHNHLFVGEYKKKYNGEVDIHDEDEIMVADGKFYSINKIFNRLKPAHQRALYPYLKKSLRKKYMNITKGRE